jgi:hypothetical protein
MLLILCIILFAIIYILDLKTKAIIKKKMEKSVRARNEKTLGVSYHSFFD